ncbi:hypothetical protein [Sediminitomix flava]|uniref:Cell division protein ZapB n=1 Tax=Sediminitomix flava TaxID=379075 RepID=A0A315ZH04_SEDFL|nr:hypothetical protein [Sediminitomix flava]PWJ44453.1 hypothetical protein BC781_101824 [Sediminitomix flava]
MKTNQEDKKIVKGKTNILILLIAVLLLINGMQWFYNDYLQLEDEKILVNKELELVNTYDKLDSISNELHAKIREIEELNGNVDALMMIKEDLEKEKQTLKVSQNLTSEEFENIRLKVQHYEALLLQKEKDILSLNHRFQQLTDENDSLKIAQSNMKAQIKELESENSHLTQLVEEASILRATAIQFTGKNNKGSFFDADVFNPRKTELIKILFTLEQNPLIDQGPKEIILRLIEPGGAVIYQQNSSGKFKVKEKELFYTDKKKIEYPNTLNNEFGLDCTRTLLVKGKYTVELYSKESKIGESNFMVQ